MSSTTPLLLLLDGVLSQEQAQIVSAMAQITALIGAAREKESSQLTPSANLSATDGPSFATSESARRQEQAARTPLPDYQPLLQGPPVKKSVQILVNIISTLLDSCPALASVPSSLDGSLPLHFAASLGSVHVASLILSKFPSAVSTPNTKGKLPLHYASREGRTEMVSFLLHSNPSTASTTSTKLKLPLHFAAGEGHRIVTRRLLNAYPGGASIASAKGKLPLHFASRWSHIDIARDLLEVNPSGVRTLDWEGSLPLHDAAREGQVGVSRLLIGRYPEGLKTANIRGEVPLFVAARSGRVELVELMIRSWPAGGREVLTNLCEADDVNGWDWEILELCLRGAVEIFEGCRILGSCSDVGDGRPSSPEGVTASRRPVGPRDAPRNELERRGAKRGREAVDDTAPISRHDDTSQLHKVECATELGDQTDARRPPEQTTNSPSAPSCQESGRTSEAATSSSSSSGAIPYVHERSKSPILEIAPDPCKKTHGCRKRMRSGSLNLITNDDGGCGCGGAGDDPLSLAAILRIVTGPPRKFYPLHAALECGASSLVISRVLQGGDDHDDCGTTTTTAESQLSQPDSFGQLPLHVAAAHSRGEDVVDAVVRGILGPYPRGSYVRDAFGRLPLHVSLSTGAEFALVGALLEANPTSGFVPCLTEDARFANKMPLFMATEFDCDLDTVFYLLRGDPGVIREFLAS